MNTINEIILMGFIIAIIVGDIIWAILKINMHGPDSVWVGNCPHCGVEIRDMLIVKWVIKRITHRCENHLI